MLTALATGGLGTLAVAVGALAGARLRWRRAAAADLSALEETDLAAGDPAVGEMAAEALPEPVARYLALAIAEGSRPLRHARYRQRGEMALGPRAWKPFSADATYSARPVLFLWDALIVAAPFCSVLVRDGYRGGRGRTKASLLGLVSFADLEGGGELAVASLQRYLAELPWLPTALRPSPALQWSALDGARARATLTDAGVVAAVDFHFGKDGEIEAISALRGREEGGLLVPTPWEGSFADYRRVDGCWLPHRAEAAWILPHGRSPYWRAEIVGCELTRG